MNYETIKLNIGSRANKSRLGEFLFDHETGEKDIVNRSGTA